MFDIYVNYVSGWSQYDCPVRPRGRQMFVPNFVVAVPQVISELIELSKNWHGRFDYTVFLF